MIHKLHCLGSSLCHGTTLGSSVGRNNPPNRGPNSSICAANLEELKSAASQPVISWLAGKFKCAHDTTKR